MEGKLLKGVQAIDTGIRVDHLEELVVYLFIKGEYFSRSSTLWSLRRPRS